MHKNRLTVLKLLGVIVFIFVINEIACRLFLPAPQKIVTQIKSVDYSGPQHLAKKSLSIHEHPDEGGLYKGTPAGRRLNPNRVVTIDNHRLSKKKVVIETNSIGYRNREIAIKPQQTGYQRILFLGDSIVFQDFLNEEETFVRQIETRAHRDHKNWETINAAVGAVSLKTELAILLETGLALQPDVVVLNFYLNDFQESKGIDIVQLPTWLSYSRFLTQVATALANQKAPAKKINPQDEKATLAKWQAAFEKNRQFSTAMFNDSPAAFNTLVKNSFNDFGGAWSPEAWAYMRPLFEEFQRLSLQHHFQLVIVFHPAYYQVYTEFVDDYPQQQLAQIATELEIPLLDLLPPLRAEALRLGGPAIYHGSELHGELFYDQNHHTEVGTALVTEQIYSFLSALQHN